jgi:hypothetical protein
VLIGLCSVARRRCRGSRANRGEFELSWSFELTMLASLGAEQVRQLRILDPGVNLSGGCTVRTPAWHEAWLLLSHTDAERECAVAGTVLRPA